MVCPLFSFICLNADDYLRIDPVITPEIFAQTIVDDYGLASSYHAIITKAIQDQLSDYKAHSTTFGEDGTPQSPVDETSVVVGALEDEEVKWWDGWRDKMRTGVAFKIVAPPAETHRRKRRKVVKDEEHDAAAVPAPAPPVDKDQPMSVDDFEEDESKALEELRILVKVRAHSCCSI